MTDTFELIKSYAIRIKNTRTLNSIHNHGLGEMDELLEEIDLRHCGLSAGVDGIAGEAIDVIACMVDIIVTEYPTMTSDDFHSFLEKKLKKWESRYSEA